MNVNAITAHILRPVVNVDKVNKLRLLFCHGLGSAKRDIIANKIQQWANVQGIMLNE